MSKAGSCGLAKNPCPYWRGDYCTLPYRQGTTVGCYLMWRPCWDEDGVPQELYDGVRLDTVLL